MCNINNLYCTEQIMNINNLRKRYEEMNCCQDKVNYGVIEFARNPNQANAYLAIETEFTCRKKTRAFEYALPNVDEKTMLSRAVHSVSLYCLGMHLSDMVKDHINRLITIVSNEKFDFVWILSAFFHDCYSVYEEKYWERYGKKQVDDIPDLSKFSFMGNIYKRSIPRELRPTKNFVHTYPEKVVKDYYKQKAKYGPDHGILSGYIFYDEMVKNYFNEWLIRNGVVRQDDIQDIIDYEKKKLIEWTLESGDNKVENVFDTDGPRGKVRWSNEFIWFYAYIADAIIAHNIWHSGESKIPELLVGGEKEHKLSLKKEPLAYFLSLIDTIEPVKYFADKPVADVLNGIDITLDHGNIIIERVNANISVEKWCKWYVVKMSNMQDWLKNTRAYYCNDRIIIACDKVDDVILPKGSRA